MARLWYGGAPSDYVFVRGENVEIYEPTPTGGLGTAMLLPLDAIPFDVFTDAALTTPTTDLLDADNSPIAQVTSSPDFVDRGTIPEFQGPDGHEASLWLSADGVTGFRIEPDPTTLYERVRAAEIALETAVQTTITIETDTAALDARLDTLEAVTASPDVQIFTSSGTWNKPAGATRVFVECQGGGGAGGGAATTAAGQMSEGGGGGGGGFGASWFDADDLPSSVTVTVGAGGTGVTGADGNLGGLSEFSGQFGADGGAGGDVGAAGTTVSVAGGDRGSTYDDGTGLPDYRGWGGEGGPGLVRGGQSIRANYGGSSEGSGEVALPSATSSGNGTNGDRGAGGAGGRNAASQGTARAGGNGGPGYVRVTTFFGGI